MVLLDAHQSVLNRTRKAPAVRGSPFPPHRTISILLTYQNWIVKSLRINY